MASWWQIISFLVGIIAILLATIDFQEVEKTNLAKDEPQQRRKQQAEVQQLDLLKGYDTDDNETAATTRISSSLMKKKHTVYVIGDLHGDVECAKHWVKRIGVLDDVDDFFSQSQLLPQEPGSENKNSKNLEHAQWLKPDASLVFLGDYIDKGPFSLSTILFVKALQENFPNHVTALMGNHEMELLKDLRRRKALSNNDYKYYHMMYAVVHPEEFKQHYVVYQNHHTHDDTHRRDWTTEDDFVIDLLLNATMTVYALDQTRAIRFRPSMKLKAVDDIHINERYSKQNTKKKKRTMTTVVDFIPPQYQALVQDRLQEYQDMYEKSFVRTTSTATTSTTSLGQWMEEHLKVVHLENHVLFTHGGIDQDIATVLASYDSIHDVNALVHQQLQSSHYQGQQQHDDSDDYYDSLLQFLDDTRAGRAVEKMLFYRGNHETRGGGTGCEELSFLLQHISHAHQQKKENKSNDDSHYNKNNEYPIKRLAVGHTPGKLVRQQQCKISDADTIFLALDSLLGRWIRTSGNYYCPQEGRTMEDFQCPQLQPSCQGQIVALDEMGAITIMVQSWRRKVRKDIMMTTYKRRRFRSCL